MGEGPEHEVERAGYWRSIENRRKAGIAAALALAAQSTLAGVVRLVVQEPVAGLEVRSRWLDVTFYLGASFSLVVLALTAPLD